MKDENGHETGEWQTPLQKAQGINAELLADEKKFKTHLDTYCEYRSKISGSLAKTSEELQSQETELAQLQQARRARREEPPLSLRLIRGTDLVRRRSSPPTT